MNTRRFCYLILLLVLFGCAKPTPTISPPVEKFIDANIETVESAKATGTFENGLTPTIIPTKLPTPSATPEPSPTPIPKRYTAILLGEDRSGTGNGARTDVIAILNYIPKYNDLLIISVHRDLYVDYTGAQAQIFCNPPSEFDRINRAYALGGVDCVRAVIEHNFGLVANSGIAAVDFQGFVEITNHMGGLTIVPTKSRSYWCGSISNGDASWVSHLEGESYLMYGESLLCYVRERMQYGGIDRDLRAQEVLLAMKEQWLDARPIKTIFNLLPFMLERVSVDLTVDSIAGLIELAKGDAASDVNIRRVIFQYDQEVTPHITENGAWVFRLLVDLRGWTDCLLGGHSSKACAWLHTLDADY